jgi:hypothetical protein
VDIWKFSLDLVDRQTVMMPRGAVVIAAQEQDGRICLWAIVDPKANLTSRMFAIVGTGMPLPSQMGHLLHLATVQLDRFVWHVFEL